MSPRDEDGKDDVVVLSYGLWQSRYGGALDMVGRSILLDGQSHVVVGVAPPMEGTGLATDRSEDAQLWRPNGYLGVAADRLPNRGSESWAGIGRLLPGRSLEQAQLDVAHVADALVREYPESNYGRGVLLRPLQDQIVGDSRPSLLLLAGAVGLLFLVALVNVAGVLLGRAAERLHDTAVRAALGAGRWDLLRRDLTEGVVPSSLGCLLGLPFAWAMIRLLVAWVGHALPRPVMVSIDGRILTFAIASSLLAGVLCSLPPTFSLLWRSLAPTLRAGATSLAGSRSTLRTRNVFVVAEVGLSLVLLFGAALLGVGLLNLHAVDTGVDSANLLTFQLRPPRSAYPDAGALDGFYQQLLDRLGALPGVESAALTNIVPLSGDFDGNGVWADDWPERTVENELSAQTRTVSAGYFETMRIELVRGRTFGREDGGAEEVAILNRRLSHRLWPGADPIGRFVRSSADDSEPIRVVGVVEDVKHLSLEEDSPPRIYFPRSQGLVVWQLRRATVVVRTTPTNGADSSLRPRCPGAHRGWHLRRHLACRHSAQAGGRDPHGARRGAKAGRDRGAASDPGARRRRPDRRRRPVDASGSPGRTIRLSIRPGAGAGLRLDSCHPGDRVHRACRGRARVALRDTSRTLRSALPES